MEPQIEASPMSGSFDVFVDGFLPLSGVPGGTYDEAQVGALVGDRDAAPVRVGFMDCPTAENVQAAREKGNEH
eukprot:11119452-Heterocapsa_arctica.AAC.1